MTKIVQVIIRELDLQVTIRELDRVEMNNLLVDDVYKHFFPVRCSSCETKNGFNRHIFHITGVQRKKQADDVTQNMLQYHFLHYHKIKYVFFRAHSKKFYADSAKCSSCKSTAIVFDISPDYTDYVMSEYKKTIGKNII
jgi:hypothetical protein